MRKTMTLDTSKITNIEWDGIDTKDYPDFSDATACYFEYDGKEATDEQLDYFNDNLIGDFHDQIIEACI